TISGFVDTSAVWNPGTGNANPAPYGFNAGKQDGFNLDQVDIKISKAMETGKWSAGYVAEISYGPDASAIDGGSGAYPIRQAYVDLGVPVGNGLELKVGRWDNIIGYEAPDPVNNPNWTHSYAWTMEPTEHTGLLASYSFADWINLKVGAADTLTTGAVNSRVASAGPPVESKKTVVSLLTLTAPDSWGWIKGSSFYLGCDHGQGVYGRDQTDWYTGATLNTPVKDLTLGGTIDEIQHSDVGGFDAGSFTSFVGYASYKLTEKLTFSGRAEYDQGNSLGAAADASNLPGGYAGGTPANPLNEVFALTGTLQYDLWANVITRLEVRWDHAANGQDAFGGNGALGTALPDKKNEVMFAANVIYKF
ncbi:MAG TPA: outer membrane beta-barrel protein, partial [Candidatus Saccharimonadales bacterium]|nr:outer membrane beta-barrel protein [Candidatus Saccharimonadales bacterium]